MPGCVAGGLIAALWAGLAVAGPDATYLGTAQVVAEGGGLGGLSAIEVGADGLSFVALSDSAVLFQGQFVRDAAGVVTGATVSGPGLPLLDAAGVPLDHPMDDSEGLAVLPDRVAVSFELENRVAEYDLSGRLVQALPAAPEFAAMTGNWGLEALAAGPDGALYAIPEGDATGPADSPVYRLFGGEWAVAMHLPGAGTFRPVGADVGPDGRLYILERDYWPLIGFRTRLSRVTIGPSDPPQPEVLLQTPAGRHGNLEGLSVWADGDGRLVATMVADNNFLPLTPSEIVEYALPD